MRCFDEHKQAIFAGAPPHLLSEVLKELVAVDIDNATRWFYEKNTQEFWDYEKDFPCALSPWKLAWYESGMPKTSNNEGRKIHLNSPFRKVGWLVHQMPLKENLIVPAEPIALKILAAAGANTEGFAYSTKTVAAINDCKPRFTQMAKLYGFTWDNRPHHLMAEYCYLNNDGQIIRNSRGAILLTPKQSHISESQKEQMARELTGIFLAFYFSLSLIHSKNITLSDEPVTTQKKKRLTGPARPKTTFKILDIHPLRATIKRVNSQNSPDSEVQRALHLCRGHFRRYTDESKLFGKHIGVFWIPEHKRGSSEVGKVEKDYRLADSLINL